MVIIIALILATTVALLLSRATNQKKSLPNSTFDRCATQ